MSEIGYISVNIEKSENDATQIESAAAYFKADSINPMDQKTTLNANTNLHLVFADSQALIVSLGEAMDKEVKNIRSLGSAFEEYDHMLAGLGNQMGE